MKHRSITALGPAVFLLLFASQAAQAQSSAGKVVTRDELRTCMNTEGDLTTRRHTLEERGKVNRDEAVAINTEKEELDAEAKRVESGSGNADRFSRRVKAYNTRVQTARGHSDALRTDMEALNKSLVAYNEQCGGISYSKEDKDAILKERETAKK
jgi:uncharacterized protein involved in exopolysaccharide biosynthesis